MESYSVNVISVPCSVLLFSYFTLLLCSSIFCILLVFLFLYTSCIIICYHMFDMSAYCVIKLFFKILTKFVLLRTGKSSADVSAAASNVLGSASVSVAGSTASQPSFCFRGISLPLLVNIAAPSGSLKTI